MGPKPDRERLLLIHKGLRLEWLTIGWLAIEAAVAMVSSVAAHSLSLLAFGMDSVIELGSAGVLLWRLTAEVRHGDAFPVSVEHRAQWIGGLLLFALAAYVGTGAIYGLWQHLGQEFSGPGFILATLTIPVMWLLTKSKFNLATRLGSDALRTDAVESLTCMYMATVVLLGLIGQRVMPQCWWIDSVASLAIAGFVLKEGREAWQGENRGD